MKIKRKQQKRALESRSGVTISRPAIPLQGRPNFADTIKFPDDLTRLNSVGVSELHGKYTQMAAYAREELCKASVEYIQSETEESLLRNKIFRDRPSLSSVEKWRKELVVNEDPAMEALHRRQKEIKIKMEWHKTFLENYTLYLNALSRELSRKMQDHTR